MFDPTHIHRDVLLLLEDYDGMVRRETPKGEQSKDGSQ